jgi:PH (Pleckstrin Homology) domain-containing protein
VKPDTEPGSVRGSSLWAVGKYLLPAERVVVAMRRHWVSLATPLLISGGGLLVALIVDIALPQNAGLIRVALWLAWAATVGYLGWHLLNWWSDRFVVTDKRVMLVHGLINRDVDMMPLTKVTDMRYERSLTGRFLGYGDFVMESAGQGRALSRVSHIWEPDWLYREICALLFTPGQTASVSPATNRRLGGGTSARSTWLGYGPSDPDPDGHFR